MPVAEERGVTKANAKSCPCEACKKGRNEPSKIAPMSIHGYSSQPRGGWRKQQAASETAAPTLFMGVELETTVGDDERDTFRIARRRAEAEVELPTFRGIRYDDFGNPTPEWRQYQRDLGAAQDQRYFAEERIVRELNARRRTATPTRATAEEAVSLAEPIGFWHAKHDGSVTGPEFASLPGSLAYWYSIRDDLSLMFTSLLHAGVRSHTGDTAGMHISMSVEAFVDSDHLMRFAKLVNSSPRWSQRMSQRTAHSMSWCHIGTGLFGPGRDADLYRWAKQVMKDGEASRVDRYMAINATCGGGRIEFRLPRGTLRIDRFYKNLEWVASMVEFSRKFAATDPSTYMRWVMAQEGYADLKGWFVEKFHLTVSNDGFTPEAAPAPTDMTVVNAYDPNRMPSLDSRYCPCGDGCYLNECDSCYSDEYDEPEMEEDEERYCGTCGSLHDDNPVNYIPAGQVHWSVRHEHESGIFVGPRRQYDADGVEYEYDTYGVPIPTVAQRERQEQLVQDRRLLWQQAMNNLRAPSFITHNPVTFDGEELVVPVVVNTATSF